MSTISRDIFLILTLDGRKIIAIFLLSRKALIEIGIDKLLQEYHNTIMVKFQVHRVKRKRKKQWFRRSIT